METTIGIFTITKIGYSVTIVPGLLVFNGKRNASSTVTTLSQEDVNYRYKQFVEYAETHTMVNRNLN